MCEINYQAEYQEAARAVDRFVADNFELKKAVLGAIRERNRLRKLNAELRASLVAMLDHYTQLAGCGDCGNWDPEDEQIVKATRALLAKAAGGDQ